MAMWTSYLHGVARRRSHHAARFIRRTTIHCPRTGEPADVDLLMRATGAPEMVLRCSAHRSCPPTCDQACRTLAEAVLAPVHALIMCPPGDGPPEEID